MKTALFMTFLTWSLCASASFGGMLPSGNYECKRGFLNWKKVDSLSINYLENGTIQIDMDLVSFDISKNCKVLNHTDITTVCDSKNELITLSKKEGRDEKVVYSSIAFQRFNSYVVVREVEKSTSRNQEIILVCRPI